MLHGVRLEVGVSEGGSKTGQGAEIAKGGGIRWERPERGKVGKKARGGSVLHLEKKQNGGKKRS